MANLETLTIEINANAQGASEGISSLIGSLRTLEKVVNVATKPLQGLMSILNKIRGAGKVKVPSIVDGANASDGLKNMQQQTSAIRDQTEAINQRTKAVTQATNTGMSSSYSRRDSAIGKFFRGEVGKAGGNAQQWAAREIQQEINADGIEAVARRYGMAVSEIQSRMQELNGTAKEIAQAVPQANNHITEGMQEVQTSAEQTSEITQQANQDVKDLTDTIDKASNSGNGGGKLAGFTKIFNKISKAVLSMLIIKPIIKSIKESFTGLYQYSKANNGEFAKSVDQIKGALNNASIKISSAFAPALSALVPVITVVSQAVSYLASLVQWLCDVLGVASEFFDASAESINSYAQKSKAAKESLGSMDELNVVGQNNSGNGESGGNFSLVDTASDDLARLSVIIGESLLAVGLIMACAGQYAIGIGLMVVGGAAIANTVAANWGALSEDTKGEISTIMAAVGGAMLGIGFILAATGHLPIGIGLMIAGVANLATAVAISDTLSSDVKKKIETITAIVGGAMLALGAVLAFTGANIPLGIAAMVIGAASLVASIAISDSLKETIEKKIGLIATIVGGALLALGAVLAFTGASIPLGVALMAIGAVSLAAGISASDQLSQDIKSTVTTIAGILGGALLVIGAILCFTGAGIPLGLGMMAIGGVTLAAAIAPNWTSLTGKVKSVFESVTTWIKNAWKAVTTAVSNAWNAVKKWWETSGIGTKVRKIWDGVKSALTSAWNAVKNGIKAAWDFVKKWWETSGLGNKVRKVWQDVKKAIAAAWSAVKTTVSSAWKAVTNWWGKNIYAKVKGVWDSVKGHLTEAWNTVKTKVSDAWEKVKTWIGAKWADFSSAWASIKENLSGAWETVKDKVSESWEKVKMWVGAKWAAFKVQWETIKGNLCNAWVNVKNSVIGAWNRFVDWKNAKWADLQAKWDRIKVGLTGAWVAVKNKVIEAWNRFIDWKNATWDSIKGKWENIKANLSGIWDTVKTSISNAWNAVSQWWTDNQIASKIWGVWSTVKSYLLDNIWTPLATSISNAWDNVSDFFGDISGKIQTAWGSIATWFDQNVSTPIGNFFKAMVNAIIDAMNWLIKKLNSLGHIKWDEVKVLGVTIIPKVDTTLFRIPEIAHITATGMFDVPKGDLFLSREAGPELVGRIGGHNSVVNNEQIVESVSNGVRDANAEQNELLREQNRLLMAILRKDNSVRVSASSALGKTVRQSLDMYSTMVGG